MLNICDESGSFDIFLSFIQIALNCGWVSGHKNPGSDNVFDPLPLEFGEIPPYDTNYTFIGVQKYDTPHL